MLFCSRKTTTRAKARIDFEDLRGPKGPLFHGRTKHNWFGSASGGIDLQKDLTEPGHLLV
jgi:hypothetical protein